MKRITTLFIAVLLLTGLVLSQEAKKPPLSPPGTAEFSFDDGKKVTIQYSRPSMRGRKIMGGLVPYGEVWRTGANAATSLVTTADLDIGGTNVPAGSYTVYTLPSAEGWKLIINKQTGQWGTDYDQSKDLARIDMAKTELKQPLEQFTIHFEPAKGSATKMLLDWETTSASVDIKQAK
jgi:hypothetical protein